MLDAWTIKEWLLFWSSIFLLVNGAQIVLMITAISIGRRLLHENELVRVISSALKRDSDS